MPCELVQKKKTSRNKKPKNKVRIFYEGIILYCFFIFKQNIVKQKTQPTKTHTKIK